jgi:hypothetical protein
MNDLHLRNEVAHRVMPFAQFVRQVTNPMKMDLDRQVKGGAYHRLLMNAERNSPIILVRRLLRGELLDSL